MPAAAQFDKHVDWLVLSDVDPIDTLATPHHTSEPFVADCGAV